MSSMCEECKCTIKIEDKPDGSRDFGGCDSGCSCCNETFIEMTYEDWVEKYKPIHNHIRHGVEDPDYTNYAFETYGEEYELVKAADPACVWTEGDGDDGGMYIWNGWHFINRIQYFITEIPCPEGVTIQIQTSIKWYCCEKCGKEWEDADSALSDKYEDCESCPDCDKLG